MKWELVRPVYIFKALMVLERYNQMLNYNQLDLTVKK